MPGICIMSLTAFDKLNMKKIFIAPIAFIFSLYCANISGQAKIWTIQDCINEALKQNVQLNITRRTNDANMVNLTQAKYAQYPSLNGNASQALNFGRSLDPSTYQYINQSIYNNTFSLTSSFVIYEGRSLYNAIQQDKVLYDAGNMDIENYQNTIILGVASAYLQILLDYELIRIAKSTTATDSQQINLTKVMVTAGSVPELNLYQVQSQLAADNYTLIGDLNQLALDKLTIEQLMEMPSTPGFDIERPKIPEPPHKVDSSATASQIYDQSVENQPQIKSTEKKLAGANLGIEVIKGTADPRLVLNSSLNTNYASTRDKIAENYNLAAIGFLQSNPNALVYGEIPVETKTNYPFFNQLYDNIGAGFTFSLVVPIFNNYTIRANVQQATIARDVAKLNNTYTHDQFRKTIEQSYTDLIGSNKQYISSLEALRTETEAYNTMVVKYQGGTANASDLVLEKNKFTTVQSQVVEAKYNYVFKQKVLDFYLGKPISLQ